MAALDSFKDTVNQSIDWGTKTVRQADQALADRGVTPVGGMALATGAIGAAALLKHLLSNRNQTSHVR